MVETNSLTGFKLPLACGGRLVLRWNVFDCSDCILPNLYRTRFSWRMSFTSRLRSASWQKGIKLLLASQGSKSWVLKSRCNWFWNSSTKLYISYPSNPSILILFHLYESKRLATCSLPGKTHNYKNDLNFREFFWMLLSTGFLHIEDVLLPSTFFKVKQSKKVNQISLFSETSILLDWCLKDDRSPDLT